jgi:hypothetical protein
MIRSNRPWLFFTVSTAVLAVSSVLVGMTNHRIMPAESTESENVKGFSKPELDAKNVLKNELERRFTDRQNVEFGMSRVVRVGSRMHYGPTMDKTQRGVKEKTRPLGNGRYEFEFDGAWYKMDDRKPRMTAENERESRAMKLLRDSKIDVAIYTVGQFELDKGEKPTPMKQPASSNPNYQDFSYGSGNNLRVKGPAYTHQDAAMAPRAYELVDFGRLAWASKQVDYTAEGKDGWVYFAHRVNSNDASCARCHGDRKAYVNGETKDIKGAIQKPGDPVGLFVIAVRRADAK